MSPPDPRWIQRLHNYRLALARLKAAIELSTLRPLTELEQQGLIQGFEYTHELGWNVLKDFLVSQGYVDLVGSRDATREAFKNNLIDDGEAWMDMIRARNLTSHTHKAEIAAEVVRDIIGRYFPAFDALEQRTTAVRIKEKSQE